MIRFETQESADENIPKSTRHPELVRFREFLGIVDNINEISAWLVEAAAGADPLVRGVKQAHLARLFQQLGIDPDTDSAYRQFWEMKHAFKERAIRPRPLVDVPGPDFFTSRIKEIIGASEATTTPLTHAMGRVTLEEVAVYGHTDWRAVGPRGTSNIGEYIHGVATVMSDPVAYHLNFARADFGLAHANDHMVVKEDWKIFNGRHRSLAARALGKEYLTEAGMSQWIDVKVGDDPT